MIRRGDINPTLLDGFTVPGMHGGEPTCPRENVWEMTALFGSAANMQHDEYSGREIARQGSGEHLQRLNSTCGGTDHDNVLFRHPVSHLMTRLAPVKPR